MTVSSDNNIISAFLQAASANPGNVALLQDGERVTYAELQADTVAAAGHYRSLGIGQGDMVLVFVPMSPDLYRIVLALFYIGACPVFLDEWVSVRRLKSCLKVVPCRALIAKPSLLFLSWFIGPLRRIPVRTGVGKALRQGALALPSAVNGDDTALITFTTGSTGTPKAANRTHAYLWAQLHALAPLLDAVASPCLTSLPIVVLLHLATGKTALLPPQEFKASKPATICHLRETVKEAAPAAIIASPAIVSMLIRSDNSSEDELLRIRLSGVLSVLTGGGPVYPDLAADMLKAFPSAKIIAVYGSTEAEPISHITAPELAGASTDLLLLKGLPVGHPDEVAEVAILNLESDWSGITDSGILAKNINLRNVPGEVIVAGPHVLRTYINNPQAEKETKLHIDGKVWHRTGDCALQDREDNIYLLGRVNEIFTWNGRQYYPSITTYALQVLTGVRASALLLKDKRPLVILEQSDRKLLPKVRQSLTALYLEGAEVRLVSNIPKDPRHQTKVDYAKLKRILN